MEVGRPLKRQERPALKPGSSAGMFTDQSCSRSSAHTTPPHNHLNNARVRYEDRGFESGVFKPGIWSRRQKIGAEGGSWSAIVDCRELFRAKLEGRLPMNLTYEEDRPWRGVVSYAARNQEFWDRARRTLMTHTTMTHGHQCRGRLAKACQRLQKRQRDKLKI